MKFLIVLASVIGVGLCQLVGGKHDQPQTTFPKYLALALQELPGIDATDHVEVVRVQTQVVAGINTFITLKVNGRTCEIDMYDRAWENFHQVTRNTCVLAASKRQLGGMPGGWSKVTDLSDSEVQKALTMVLDQVNNRINSMYRMTESQVTVEQQVVAGMNYRIHMVVQQSSCLNNQANQHLMASHCPVNAQSGVQPVVVDAIVYSKPWENFMQISSFSTKTEDGNVDVAVPDEKGYKPHAVTKLLGGDDHDYVIHGKGSDAKTDTQKTLIGGDDHDYRRHGYPNMGGYRMGPGMMYGYKMGPDMMKDYKVGPDMMKDYGMGPDMMKDYGMGPDMMKDYYNKMGPNMMKDYGMGPDMMKDYFNKMGPDMMKDYNMGPDMMENYLKEGGDTLIGGDTHDYQKHGEQQLGGDDHDYQPHGNTEAPAANAECSQEMFLDFQLKYSKNYGAGKETTKRYNIFCDNLRKAAKLQQTEKGTARYGVTKFSDLTEEEFKQYVSKPWQTLTNFNTEMKKADIPKGTIPESFDWRDHGAVTPVKNQGSCGSCWAFSTTGNIEGQWAIKKQKLISLSEQELVDCDKLDDGCSGGLPSNAYKEIERLGGLETETEYKYRGEDEKCQFIKKDVKVYINSSVTISSNETDMASWLAANGPISIGINAFAMQFYMGGISHPWKIFCNPKNLDHGVLIVGYGVQGSKPYWIIKNSWGENWGEKGYYFVYRGAGVCGLNTMCTSAVVN